MNGAELGFHACGSGLTSCSCPIPSDSRHMHFDPSRGIHSDKREARQRRHAVAGALQVGQSCRQAQLDLGHDGPVLMYR